MENLLHAQCFPYKYSVNMLMYCWMFAENNHENTKELVSNGNSVVLLLSSIGCWFHHEFVYQLNKIICSWMFYHSITRKFVAVILISYRAKVCGEIFLSLSLPSFCALICKSICFWNHCICGKTFSHLHLKSKTGWFTYQWTLIYAEKWTSR